MNKRSALLRIPLHGFFLISSNLFSVMAAFVIVLITEISEDLIQSTLALLINLGLYLLVYKLLNGIQEGIMKIDNFSMFAIIFLVSLALLPAVFYPMQYLIQGYWSSFDNLLAIWPFQIFVNGLCLVMNYFFLRRK